MGKRASKRNQRYVDCPRYRSKLTYMIHDNVHYSEQCKLLNDFGTRYASTRTFK